ncbi:hypothetical protein GGF47_004219, partial [Coemansia sp. RSA 2524]
ERARESSLVMASVNVNGLPREGEVAVEELANIMVGFGADILAVQETKLTAEGAERLGRSLATHQLTAKFSCAPESEQAQQKGVAVLLAPKLRNHLVGVNEVVAGPTQTDSGGLALGQALGTGIRLRLAFRGRQEMHVIAVYMPHKATNPESWARTQKVVAQWIRRAQSQGKGLLVLGDFNERINQGLAQTEVGQLLFNSDGLREAHRSLYGQQGGETSPHRQGAQRSRIDFIFASTHLGQEFRQSTVVQGRTELGEDHSLIAAEWAVNLGQRGPAQVAPTRQPRLNISGASDEACQKFTAELEELDFHPDELDKRVWELAAKHFGTLKARRAQAQKFCRRSLAGKIRQVLEHRLGGGPSKQAQWLAAVEECHKVLTDGLPQGVRDHCQQLIAGAVENPDWKRQQKVLTNLMAKRLRALRKRESAQALSRKIIQAVGRRAEQMETNLGGMVRSLRRGPITQLLSRVVVEEAGAIKVSTTAEEVELESSTHFDRHFTHPRGQQQIEVSGPWAAEYEPMSEIED